MPDIAGLIAPRPAFFENGTRDSIFPVAAFRRAVNRLEYIYDAAGVPDRVGHEIFEGEYQFHGVGAFKFLIKWL